MTAFLESYVKSAQCDPGIVDTYDPVHLGTACVYISDNVCAYILE